MSGDIGAALQAYQDGQGPEALIQACADPPRGPKPSDPLLDEDPEPISGGADFDTVTAAWIAGTIPDDVYQACLSAGSGSPRS